MNVSFHREEHLRGQEGDDLVVSSQGAKFVKESATRGRHRAQRDSVASVIVEACENFFYYYLYERGGSGIRVREEMLLPTHFADLLNAWKDTENGRAMLEGVEERELGWVVKVAQRHGMNGVAMQTHVLDHISVLGVGVPLVNYAKACKDYVLWRNNQGIAPNAADDDAGDAAVPEVQQQVIPQLQALRGLAPDAVLTVRAPDVERFWAVNGVPDAVAAIVVDKCCELVGLRKTLLAHRRVRVFP